MDLAAVSSIQEGFQEVYLLCWPIDVPLEDGMSGQCMVVVKREGGVLLAVPLGFIPTEALQAAAQHAEQSLLGPHTVLTIPSARFLDGQLVPTEESMDVQVVDVSLDVLLAMRPFVLGMELQEPMAYGYVWRRSRGFARSNHSFGLCQGMDYCGRTGPRGLLFCRGARDGRGGRPNSKGGQSKRQRQ